MRPPAAMVAYCDGGCWPNPGGLATWGFMVETQDGEYVAHDAGAIPPSPATSNNVAEYEALIRTLEWATEQGADDLQIRMDSQMVVRQMCGEWGCYAEHLVPLYEHARSLLKDLGPYVTVRWIPREQNESADALTIEARRKWEAENEEDVA